MFTANQEESKISISVINKSRYVNKFVCFSCNFTKNSVNVSSIRCKRFALSDLEMFLSQEFGYSFKAQSISVSNSTTADCTVFL